ncbi:MAG: PaaI family thioesterase [Alphaproteobacteria bacterium]|nr:PaaI family thioesterase [Alphaproteobacteria bacterium]
MTHPLPDAWAGPGHVMSHDKPIPEGFETAALFDPFEIYVGPFFQSLGNRPRAHAFRVDERHLNLQGVCHGGMLMTFADSSLGLAAWAATDRAPCVTASMQSQFLKPARLGDLVVVTPEVTRRTRELVFIRGDFMVGDTMIATVSSIWKLLAPA